MQEIAYGGPIPSHTRPAAAAGAAAAPSSARFSNKDTTKAPTANLIRSWRGEVHEVLADDGYVYRGEIFQKLSPIARRITGMQWSGPAFFGTKQAGMV